MIQLNKILVPLLLQMNKDKDDFSNWIATLRKANDGLYVCDIAASLRSSAYAEGFFFAFSKVLEKDAEGSSPLTLELLLPLSLDGRGRVRV